MPEAWEVLEIDRDTLDDEQIGDGSVELTCSGRFVYYYETEEIIEPDRGPVECLPASAQETYDGEGAVIPPRSSIMARMEEDLTVAGVTHAFIVPTDEMYASCVTCFRLLPALYDGRPSVLFVNNGENSVAIESGERYCQVIPGPLNQ